MRLTSETKDGIAVLTISGKFVFDESLLLFREKVRGFLHAGTTKFIFDFSGVPYCDSSGCGEIIGAFASIRKAGGVVAFLKPAERVYVLWTRIRLTDLFNIFKTLDEAEAFVRR